MLLLFILFLDVTAYFIAIHSAFLLNNAADLTSGGCDKIFAITLAIYFFYSLM